MVPTPGGHSGVESGWGPALWVRGATAVAGIASAAWWVYDSRPEDRVVAAVLVVVFFAITVVLSRAKVRLRADADGLVIAGPLRRERFAWPQVTAIRTPHRGRFGRGATSLELDLFPAELLTEYDAAPRATPVDEAILRAFGAFELGTDPAEVARVLRRLRAENPPR